MSAPLDTEKLCRKCGRLLASDQFPSDGYSPCRQCRRFQQENWRRANWQHVKAYSRVYQRKFRAANPDYGRRRKRPEIHDPQSVKRARDKYRTSHREQLNADSRAYYQAHRDDILAQKKRKKHEAAMRQILQAVAP